MTATDSAPDATAVEAFLGKVLVDTSGFGVTVLGKPRRPARTVETARRPRRRQRALRPRVALVQEWLPAMPDVDAKLRAGADVADVGCGRGRGLVRLAEQYPASRFVGYDVFPPTIAAARANAEAAGVGDRVRFEHRDAAAGLPEPYDVVFTFDVVHDAVDPRGLLAAIRAALRPDGIYVCLDINSSPDLAGNVGPLGAFFHSASVLYCLTASLAHGGEGLGTCGFHDVRAAEYCAQAGFSIFRQVPLDNPFNNLYEARA